MIRYEKLQGVKLPAVGGPSIVVTPEGKAMGHIPGWKALIDPSYLVDTGTRNRALPSNILKGLDALTYGAFGGNTAFTLPPRSRSNGPIARFDMNPSAWTWFCVVKNEMVTPGGASYLLSPISSIVGGILPYIVLRTAGQVSVASELPQVSTVYRVSADTAALSGSPASLIMVTFSTSEGIKMFKNGALVAENKADKNALTDGYQSGNLQVMPAGATRASGSLLLGLQGLLDIDLGAAENAGYRRIIERFILAKYSITA
ncbi:MAG: hypothetical protein RSD82_14850 [Comamonas sp.]